MGTKFCGEISIVLFIWLMFLGNLLAQQPPLNLDFQVDTQQITPGLQYFHFQSDSTQGVPLSIHILEVNVEKIRLDIALAMDQIIGQETVSSLARRKGAIAGINGGFSFSNDPRNIFHGDPRDFLVQNGKILSEPLSTRASFGIENLAHRQRPFFEQIAWRGSVCNASERCIQLTGINRVRGENDLILYTPEWHRSTLTNGKGIELVISNDTVVEKQEAKGSAIIPTDGFVLSASGAYLDSIMILQTDKLTVNHQLYSLLDADKYVPIQNTSYHTAGPILMLNGQALAHRESENIPEHFVTTRHPRTGIGISEDEQVLWLLVVDGRQPGLSVGMNLPELTQFFQRLGAFHAYNLDGGGSSTIVVDGQIKNSPSDGKERRRCDALLLFRNNK